MKRQLKKIVCLALITSMILGQKTLKTTKNVTAKEKKVLRLPLMQDIRQEATSQWSR